LNHPVRIEVTPVASTAEKVEQAIYFVERENKRALLLHLLTGDEITNALVFTGTKFGADKLCYALQKANIKVQSIHGDKSQVQRQNALEDFKNRKIQVLVATDIAARGIDIENLSHVLISSCQTLPKHTFIASGAQAEQA
jgi:ATP-dependent RNA helicase RhlE